MSVTDPRVAWGKWHEDRLTSVASASGNLALIQATWFEVDERYEPTQILAGLPDSIISTELERRDFDGTLSATGYRLWDSKSPAIKAFKGIDTFEFDPNWLIEGSFRAFPASTPVPFEYLRDNGETRDLAVPGEIEVVIAGEIYRLNAFSDEGKLLLVFGDLTNGIESYGSGRFLFVDQSPGNNSVILDFNRAFVPPCGFSIHYNCPIPPIQNRVKVAIRAGEKNAVFSPELVH